MAAFVSIATGDWGTGTTWNIGGFPGIVDTVTIAAGHVVTLDGSPSCASLAIAATGELTDVTNNVGLSVDGAIVVDGTLTLGTAEISFTNLSGAAGTLVVGAGLLSASGVITLDNMTVTTAAATITGDVDLGNVGGAGSLTMSADLTINGGFLLDGGILAADGNEVTVDGDFAATSGTATDMNLTMTGTGIPAKTLVCVIGAMPDLLTIAAGATISSAGIIWTEGLAGSGEFVLDHTMEFTGLSAGWWTYTGAMTGAGTIDIRYQTAAPGGDIIVGGTVNMMIRHNTTGTMVMDGGIDLGANPLAVYGTLAGDWMELDMNGHPLRCGALTVGAPGGTTGYGIVKFGEAAHSIASLADGHDDNDGNEVDLESCHLECSGNADFDNIAHDADADDIVHIVCTGAGEINNFDPAKIVHCHGDASVDAVGNNGVNVAATFNAHAPPGSLALMGAGV